MSLAALIVALAALAASSVLAVHQIRTAQRANQLPVVFEIFRFLRSAEVRRKEDAMHAGLAGHDPALGFRGLPEPMRSDAQEVCSYYNMVGYLILLKVVDARIAILPLHYRVAQVWATTRPYVEAERTLRTGQHSFMNGLEALAARVETMDVETTITKLTR